jgi:hypothetical protein
MYRIPKHDIIAPISSNWARHRHPLIGVALDAVCATHFDMLLSRAWSLEYIAGID